MNNATFATYTKCVLFVGRVIIVCAPNRNIAFLLNLSAVVNFKGIVLLIVFCIVSPQELEED